MFRFDETVSPFLGSLETALGTHHPLPPRLLSSKSLPSRSRSMRASNCFCASDLASCPSSSRCEKLKLSPPEPELDCDEDTDLDWLEPDMASCRNRSHALPDCLLEEDCCCCCCAVGVEGRCDRLDIWDELAGGVVEVVED